MKAFTERNPRRIGAVAVAVMVALAAGVFFLNRSIFTSTYTVEARFSNAAGLGPGAAVTVAGVQVGTVRSVRLDGNSVLATMSVNRSVTLPAQTAAAIEVETVLGVLDVALQPLSGWDHPLRNGALITDTSVPVEFQNVENTGGRLLEQSDVHALNQLLTAVADIAKGKEAQVAQIISGLDRFTGVIDARSSEVSQLIDAAQRLSATVAQHDQQLSGVVASLTQVVQGLADRSGQLASLIQDTDQLASQTASLIGQNRPQLQQLLDRLQSVLGVVAAHQDDLAEAVSYLDSAITGFASIGYSGSTPLPWANIYFDVLGSTGVNELLGSCDSVVSSVLRATLGPDPLPCSERVGPPITSTSGPVMSATPSSSTPASQAVTAGQGTSAGATSGSSNGGTGTSNETNGANVLLTPLGQVLGGLLGGLG
ncbi:MCE family protein [Aciditerrimonas ferrireducens]|uniref:MCE family protein n=1 Tax=Aciditerrimonas ferrireducens TaxID=667306 RepID=A0ABV6C081_9ACTN|nr:MlaD family protein [Aciditerrimonas ferrireducens]MCK4177911.1 MCE family protein [Aciditerrimonas ferrireducens]